MNEIPATGAHESPHDDRTFQYGDLVTATAPLVKGGKKYIPADIEHQHKEGICTAISLVQHRQKVNGKRYSPEFQYLLQKKYYDGNWYEGSSIFNALRVGKTFGFLPASEWTHTTEDDRYLPYSQYIAKLQAVSDTEVQRLLLLCVDKLTGYASIDTTDAQAIAKAIDNSEGGIICMYECGDTWWTGITGNTSWNPTDINPLRKPNPSTSGHAIIMSEFDYTNGKNQNLANTWGVTWNKQGQADINHTNYPMREAWTILEPVHTPTAFKYVFSRTLKKGMSGADVLALQQALKIDGEFTFPKYTGYFGDVTEIAVKAFQKKYASGILTPAGLTAPTGIVGPNTIKKLNSLFK